MGVITYEGFTLMERQDGGWRSIIDGEAISFDTAGQWVRYINRLIGKKDVIQ